jgi:hypothetical protein
MIVSSGRRIVLAVLNMRVLQPESLDSVSVEKFSPEVKRPRHQVE